MQSFFYPSLVVVSYLLLSRLVAKAIQRAGSRRDVRRYRVLYITRTLQILLGLVFLTLLFFSLGIRFEQVSLFLGSIFAVIGIGLFAQWSILSNITASLVIFFGFPYRIDDRVAIVEGTEHIEGVIEEITLFHVILRRGEDRITYPNNLILQRPVIRLPKGETDLQDHRED